MLTFFQSLFALRNLLFLFDYVYRSFQSVKLLAKFWRRGVVKLPQLDMRTSKPELKYQWFRTVSNCLDLIPFLSIQIILIAAIAVIVYWTFIGTF